MDKEWTIIFLIYADFRKDGTFDMGNDLQSELSQVFYDLKQVPLNNQIEILVVQNIIDPSQPEKDMTYLKRVIRQDGRKENEIVTIDSIPTPQTLQKSEVLKNIFRRMHTNTYSSTEKIYTRAKRYFLNTWDHGSVFGIFRTNVPVPEEPRTFAIQSLLINKDIYDEALLIEKFEGPFNIQKNKSGDYVSIVRSWENPVYGYYTINNKFLFELNTDYSADSIGHKLLSNDRFYNNLELEVIQPFPFINEEITIKFSKSISRNDFWKLISEINITEKEKNELEKMVSFSGDDAATMVIKTKNNKIADILTNEELQKAIDGGLNEAQSSTPPRKIDVLLMMNCYMLNVHACYTFKNVVDFLIAPQGGISKPGYNYPYLLNQIYQATIKDTIKPELLAELCVTSCGYEFWPDRREFADDIEKWAIIAMNLKDYETIAQEIENIGRELLLLYRIFQGDPYGLFDHVRNKCVRFDHPSLNYYTIDISHWLNQLIIDLSEKAADIKKLSVHYLNLRDFIDGNILEERIGKLIYASTSGQMLLKKPTSASIFFPQPLIHDEEYEYFIDKNSTNQCLFLKEKKNWLELLSIAFV
ncbi:MAG: hypothetical protein WCF67_13850 [Chitinophagaceae bacterium]